MTELNPDQFGRAPNEHEYPRYDDYLADKRKYDAKVKAGKPYIDPAERTLAKARKLEEQQHQEEFKPVMEQRTKELAAGQRKLKMISAGLSAFGMKPKGRRRR